jgi:hypothetical protein
LPAGHQPCLQGQHLSCPAHVSAIGGPGLQQDHRWHHRRLRRYFLGANDPYSALKTTLKAEINQEAWETLHSDTSRPFDKPKQGRIAVKVINHLGDEVMKVFRV